MTKSYMNIPRGALVLEVGSGNNPNPRSDILVDRYPFHNGQRAGGFRIVVDRPLIAADGYSLPFKDKAFDYVICSHTLEHMEDPKKFVKEIMRVAKAGYIEVPSDVSERIFGWDFHLWYCRLVGKTLVLCKKKEGERLGGFFHRLIADTIWFRRFFEEHEGKFYIKYEWKQNIALRMDTKEPLKADIDALDHAAWQVLKQAKPNPLPDAVFYLAWMKRRIVRKAIKMARIFLWDTQRILLKEKIIERMMGLVVCPICTSDKLVRSGDTISCKKCDTGFPVVGAIPIMLSPAERKRGY